MTTATLDHRQPPAPAGSAAGHQPGGDPTRSRRRPSTSLKWAVVGADLVAVTAGLAASFLLRSRLPGNDPTSETASHVVVAILSLPFWIAVFAHYGLYASRRVRIRRRELTALLHAVALGGLLVSAVGFATQLEVSRAWIVLGMVLVLLCVALEREAVRRILVSFRRRGRLTRPVVIVGDNGDAAELCELLQADPTLGYRVVAVVPASGGPSGAREVEPWAVVAATMRAAWTEAATGVIVVTTALPAPTASLVARRLTVCGFHVELSCSLRDLATERLSVQPLGPLTTVHVAPVVRRGWRLGVKRVIDVTVSGVGLCLAAPILLVAAVAIKLDSPGPVLFRQERVGLGSRRFKVLKLRTMVVDAEARLSELMGANEADGCLFKMSRDPRVTRVGRYLRQLSLDEVPQFWNVLRGEMSLVGPRPALPSEVERWSPEVGQRLGMKPGITGFWQVSGRSQLTFSDYLRLDLRYVDNWSLTTDLWLLAKTVPAVLLRRGAQ